MPCYTIQGWDIGLAVYDRHTLRMQLLVNQSC
jgi:hypothetical protein